LLREILEISIEDISLILWRKLDDACLDDILPIERRAIFGIFAQVANSSARLISLGR